MNYPKIVAIAGPLEGRSFDIESDPFTIGRQASSSLQLRQIPISRQHAQFERRYGEWWIRDLGSRHGTFLDGRPLTEHSINHQDVVTIGENTFLFIDRPPTEDEETGPLPFRAKDPGSPTHLDLEIGAAPFTLSPSGEPNTGDPRIEELEALLELGRQLQDCTTTEALARCVIDGLLGRIPAERGVLLALEPSGELVPTGSSFDRVPFSRGLAERVMAEKIGALWCDIPGTESSHGTDLSVSGTTEVRALLCVPLLYAQEPQGILYLEAKSPGIRFEREHLELAHAVASLAAPVLDRIRRMGRLELEKQRLQGLQRGHDLVGESAAMVRAQEEIARFSVTDEPVLITGEIGTGKELAARVIHQGSLRAEGPFIHVDCSMPTETLLGSELFGHETGGFVGAMGRRHGALEQADGGTLLLDEVGEIPLALQAKLLGVLERGGFQRLGGSETIRTRVRILAASSRDLRDEVRRRNFREDLYDRLGARRLIMPSLRERRQDIPLLALYFVRHHGERAKRPAMGLSPEVREALLRHPWPGNVRELSNVIERAVILARGELIRPEDLPEALFEAGPGTSPEGMPRYFAALNDHKRNLILDMVTASGGDIPQAAERLGLTPGHLESLIDSLQLRAELGL